MSNQADYTIVRLRVPPELKKQIEESAERNNRSQSAEMVHRLEQSFLPIQRIKSGQFKSSLVSPELKSLISTAHTKPWKNLNIRSADNGVSLSVNDAEQVLVSKDYLKELLEITNSIKTLSLAVLALESESLDDASPKSSAPLTKPKDGEIW